MYMYAFIKLYVDFEAAFQDQTTDHDDFGFQASKNVQQNSHLLADFYLQSVEIVSEIKNTNFSPSIRYQASRETSHSSTPSDTPSYLQRYNHRSNVPLNPSSLQLPTSNIHRNFNRDFANLTMTPSNDDKSLPMSLNSDGVRLKIKERETIANLSTQSKLTLPQYFLVKYLGRIPCAHLYGVQAVRTPIDDMVRKARQLSSLNEIPILEICVNMHGLTLTHRHSPTRNNRDHSPEHHQQGLIPLEAISYAMHDVKYSKIASCIVLRESKLSSMNGMNEMLTECYGFLFQSKEHAHRFTHALAEAFNVPKQSTRPSKQSHDERREGHSPQCRSRHRNTNHHDKKRSSSKYNYVKDSEV